MIVGQKRRSVGGYLVPASGEILWYGLAAAVPANWEIVTYAFDCFVVGADTGDATDTPAGSNEHFHSNPAATSEEPDHQHPIHGSLDPASGSTGFYGTANENSAPAGHEHPGKDGLSGAAGKHTHPVAATKTAEVYPPYTRLYWIRAIRATAFPVGGIMMWDDVIANAPGGFYLCDGNAHNSLTTPDLRDEFIYGAAEDGDVGQSGGSETHVHENEDVSAAGSHPHSLSLSIGDAPSAKNASGYSGGTTVAEGGHGHGQGATSVSDANHTHPLDDTDPASSLPLYLMLYFIMRTN